MSRNLVSGTGLKARNGALGMAAAVLAAVPVLAFAPDLSILSKLERGRWAVRDLETRVPRRLVCLGDPAALVRLEHPRAACSTDSITGEGGSIAVQYTCPGHGFGRTDVRVETRRAVRVETQGLRDGRPFAYRAEARRVGTC